ncbi:unnamed protein product [Lampetra planeri]
MSTRCGPSTWTSDDEDFVQLTAPEDAGETLPAEPGAIQALDTSPSAVATLQEAHEHLAELLHAATSLLAEFSLAVSPATKGAAIPLVDDDYAAIPRWTGNSVTQPARSAAILAPARSAQPAKIEDAPSAPRDSPAPTLSVACRAR